MKHHELEYEGPIVKYYYDEPKTRHIKLVYHPFRWTQATDKDRYEHKLLVMASLGVPQEQVLDAVYSWGRLALVKNDNKVYRQVWRHHA